MSILPAVSTASFATSRSVHTAFERASEHATHGRELHRILADGLVRSVYQPLVDIESGMTVGYEALSRGPAGSPLELPGPLFAAAAAAGRLAELEWACRVAAVRGALDGGLRPPLSLFINIEPSMLGTPIPAAAEDVMEEGRNALDIVLELTERALADRPGDVLAAVPRLRELGCSIAVDDVGADRRSLAFMPFLRPEVIKLDLSLVQAAPTPEIASIVHAVNAEAERTGALVLAEGIETDRHLQRARALGARYGQGWRFGRPAPLPPADELARAGGVPRLAPPRSHAAPRDATPYGLVAESVEPRRGPKGLLLEFSRHLETHIASSPEAAVLLSTFQEAVHFTPRTAELYRRLASDLAFVGALGVGLASEPAAGVRGASIAASEPLRGEWNVIVLDPHFAAAFVAQDVGDSGVADGDRRFDFCLTYDRELVVRAAETLLARVAPHG